MHGNTVWDGSLIFLLFPLFLVLSLHAAMALESVHVLISMATERGGCLYGLSDYSVIKAEAKDA